MKTETKLLVADDWEDYALLDSGHLQKLERFGSQIVIRPDPQAFWEPAQPVQSWRADARFSSKNNDEDGSGSWEILSPKARDTWPMRWNGLTFTPAAPPSGTWAFSRNTRSTGASHRSRSGRQDAG